MVYYNENDPKKAAWLRELILEDAIAKGIVDERSIKDIQPADLRGFKQCHFFAGIGVWSYALKLAGWPDNRPVWTGSCPCQPFSAAGQRKGKADDRHLWPDLFKLIAKCRPRVVFGEQVASKDGLAWLDDVQTDLEKERYACGATDICAAGFGAPHIRQRLYWAADNNNKRWEWERGTWRWWVGSEDDGVTNRGLGHNSSTGLEGWSGERRDDEPQRSAVERAGGTVDGLGNHTLNREGSLNGESRSSIRREESIGGSGVFDGLGITSSTRSFPGIHGGLCSSEESPRAWDAELERSGGSTPGPTNGFWSSCSWIPCRDGKYRPIERTSLRMADGLAADLGQVRDASGGLITLPLQVKGKARVMRLRGYGDAIVAHQAAEFIGAYMDVCE